MGGQSSKAPPGPDLSLAGLKASGRYVTLPRTGGDGNVHLIAVYPSSTHSAAEVKALIDAVRPDAVYVDLFPEEVEYYTKELEAEAAARRASPDGKVPVAVAVAARLALAELPSVQAFYKWERGLWISAEFRGMIGDELMFRLLGVGRDAPYFPALAYSLEKVCVCRIVWLCMLCGVGVFACGWFVRICAGCLCAVPACFSV